MPNSGSVRPAPAETPARPRLSVSSIETYFNTDGTVRWFDPRKDYCFVMLPNGQDALLHKTVLKSKGFTNLMQGSTVNCDVIGTPNGFKVVSLISVDNITGTPHRLKRPHQSHIVEPETDWEMVTVKRFSPKKGFGFFTSLKAPEDIFVHIETLRAGGIEAMRSGESLAARWGTGPKGLTASHVRPIQDR